MSHHLKAPHLSENAAQHGFDLCQCGERLFGEYSRIHLVGGGWARHAGTLHALTLVRGIHASDYHDAVCVRLAEMGWTVRREFAVVLGDGQGGRIDVVADRDGDRIALELDNRTPRGKSILKLMTMPQHVPTAVLLRSPR